MLCRLYMLYRLYQFYKFFPNYLRESLYRELRPRSKNPYQTHSTPGVRLASFLFFLIFGTAERTPFAPKTLWILPRGKNLTADSATLAS